MKKAVLFCVCLLFSTIVCFSQEKERRDYKYLSVLSLTNPDLDIMIESHNIFVLNFNENLDILHITAPGKRIIYVRISDFGRGKTKSGVSYSYFKALDKKGEEVLIQIYDKKNYGLVIHTGLKEGDEKHTLHFMNDIEK